MLKDEALLTIFRETKGPTVEKLRAVQIAATVDYMSKIMGEDGMYEHVVVPLNKSGQGPATDVGEFDRWGCWCGDPECLVGKYGERPEWLVKRFADAR